VNLGGVVPRSPGLQEFLREDSLDDYSDESDDSLYSIRRETGAAIAEADIIIAQGITYAQDNVLLRAEVARLQELNQAQERAMARLRFAASETSDDASEGESRPHSSEEDDADDDPCREVIDERDGLLTERAQWVLDRLHMLHTIDLGGRGSGSHAQEARNGGQEARCGEQEARYRAGWSTPAARQR
jgi:hypothetical protein